MARPTKIAEAKRTVTVKCHVTKSDKARIDQLAFDAGMTISDLIKLRVLGTEPKRRKASPERAELIKSLADLGRIGGNVNQIARALNSNPNAESDIPKDVISNTLFELRQLSKRLINVIENGH